MGSYLTTDRPDADSARLEAARRRLDADSARLDHFRSLGPQLAALSRAAAAHEASTREAADRSLSLFRWHDRLKTAATQTVLDMHAAVSAWEAVGGPAAEAADRAAHPSVHADFCTGAAVSFVAAVGAGRWDVAAWLRDHFGAAVHLKGALIEAALEGRNPALLRELVARGFVDRACPDFARAVLEAALAGDDLESALFLASRAGLCPAGIEPLRPRLQAAVLARRASAAEFDAMAAEALAPAPAGSK